MSAGLSELTGGSRSDVLTGYTLSKWALKEIGDCESEFERAFVATVSNAAHQAGLPASTRDAMIAEATAYIGKGNLKYGTQEFDLQLFQPRWVPFLLWLSLRERHPKLTREDALRLVTTDNRNVIHTAILEILGLMEPAKGQPTGEAGAGAGSTGNESSNSSAGDESSATTKSAA